MTPPIQWECGLREDTKVISVCKRDSGEEKALLYHADSVQNLLVQVTSHKESFLDISYLFFATIFMGYMDN